MAVSYSTTGSFMFGRHEIAEAVGTTFQGYNIYQELPLAIKNLYPPPEWIDDCYDIHGEEIRFDHHDFLGIESMRTILVDYDNYKEDENFIMFWRQYSPSFRQAAGYIFTGGIGAWGGWCRGVYAESFSVHSTLMGTYSWGALAKYWVTYKTEAMPAPVSIELAKLIDGYSAISYPPMLGIDLCRPLYPSSSTGTMGFQGTRIAHVTCKATDKYLMASYIIQTYTGPLGVEHFEDHTDTNWSFQKRMLLLVNMRTGNVQHFEVTPEFLGVHSSGFDPQKAAAIGNHRVIKKYRR